MLNGPNLNDFLKYIPIYFLLISLYISFYYICQYFILYIFLSCGIAHNVLVVYEGLTARMGKCEAFAGLANFGGEKHHKGRSSA